MYAKDLLICLGIGTWECVMVMDNTAIMFPSLLSLNYQVLIIYLKRNNIFLEILRNMIKEDVRREIKKENKQIE